jgi:hypothetical protein
MAKRTWRLHTQRQLLFHAFCSSLDQSSSRPKACILRWLGSTDQPDENVNYSAVKYNLAEVLAYLCFMSVSLIFLFFCCHALHSPFHSQNDNSEAVQILWSNPPNISLVI